MQLPFACSYLKQDPELNLFILLVNTFSTNKGTDVSRADFIQNLDSGSTSVRGDGTRYCDMTGDGKDDTIVSNIDCSNKTFKTRLILWYLVDLDNG